MTRRIPLAVVAAAAVLSLMPKGVSAAGIVLDFTYDSYFPSNPTALATLQKAAADINAVIAPTQLGSVVDTISRTSGTAPNTATATFDLNGGFTNPTTGANVTVQNVSIPANEIRIFVGTRNLGGGTLAQGGPGGLGFSAGANGNPAEFSNAISLAAAATAVNASRGAGPTISTLSGSLGGTPYNIPVGVVYGNLWFDSDSDNNNATDPDVLNPNYFQLDYNAAPTGKNDLYSVALHEMLHAIGYGTSDTWDSYLSGTNWTGPNVIALLGSGNNVTDGDGHANSSLMGRPLNNPSVTQTTVMSPVLITGERRFLTNVDVAFLQDLNYAIPEPGCVTLLLAAALPLRRRR